MGRMISAEDVIHLLDWLNDAEVEVWLDGGWGIDALVGEQTREHKDLDLIVLDEHASWMREALALHGFEHVRGPDWNFVLRDGVGREVDVHPVHVDQQGVGHLTTEAGHPFVYPRSALAAVGTVKGRRVKCLSAEAQVVNHSDGDYEPGDTDFHDMRLLNERFGTRLQAPYATGS
jgi:lincosamide nucleotidyltransferase A/C/D/E